MKDTHGKEIDIHPSSAAMEPCIWLGIKDPKLTIFENEDMGKYISVDFPKTWQPDALLHLNKQQAQYIVDKLQHFIDTAE